MTDKTLKRILLTTGYTTQTDKDAVYLYIKQLQEVIEEVKTEISSLMSKYFYEKDFCIEDIHLDNLLQILDKAKGE